MPRAYEMPRRKDMTERLGRDTGNYVQFVRSLAGRATAGFWLQVRVPRVCMHRVRLLLLSHRPHVPNDKNHNGPWQRIYSAVSVRVGLRRDADGPDRERRHRPQLSSIGRSSRRARRFPRGGHL